MLITGTLASFLRQYKSRRWQAQNTTNSEDLESDYLWADQICINQHDLVEKSRQVANIITIYDRAIEVLAWLGFEDEHTTKAIDWCLNISGPDSEPTECPLELGLLCARPWFRRIWVQQEAWTATLTLWIGSKI